VNPFWLTDDELSKVSEIIRTGDLINGKNVQEFEHEFSNYIGSRYAIAVNSGTAALHLALLSSGISAGDEVITSPLSFVSTANAALSIGAIPIFSDVNPSTGNIDPFQIKQVISNEVKAIIGVHLYGFPFEVNDIREIAEKNNAVLIEDAAQAIGAEYRGIKVGQLGDIACFSFFATKNLATGEGGMITTNNKEIASKCRVLRSHGSIKKNIHEHLGYNYRMNEISAAIGRIQLTKIEKINSARKQNAKILNDILADNSNLDLPPNSDYIKHVYYRYAVRLHEKISKKRSTILKSLCQSGWNVTKGYSLPIYSQPLYKQLRYRHWLLEKINWPNYEKVFCKNCELLIDTIVELPVDPQLSEESIRKMGELLKKEILKVK
jgi:perosamine synthetase|tara:strand:+ start:6270 stop:7406 length:1137 start_codon:yes stop_codon:yes gene_type:complete